MQHLPYLILLPTSRYVCMYVCIENPLGNVTLVHNKNNMRCNMSVTARVSQTLNEGWLGRGLMRCGPTSALSKITTPVKVPGIGYSVAVSENDRQERLAVLASCRRLPLPFSILVQGTEILSPLLLRGFS